MDEWGRLWGVIVVVGGGQVVDRQVVCFRMTCECVCVCVCVCIYVCGGFWEVVVVVVVVVGEGRGEFPNDWNQGETSNSLG
jgi:hypothetical protein